MHYSRLSMMVCALLAAAPDPAGAQSLIEREAQRMERFRKVQDAADNAVKQLALEGQPAHLAFATLLEQGFYCNISPIVMGVDPVKDRTEPMLLCNRYPSRIEKDCATLELSARMKWEDPKQALADLLVQLPRSKVGLVSATCRITF